MILALLFTFIALGWGAWGARLDPDSYLYARSELVGWPSPLGTWIGWAGGMPLLIVCTALAAGVLAYMVESRSGVGAFAFAACPVSWYLFFPGMDALGAVPAVAGVWRRSWALVLLAGLLHPVAGIVSAAGLLGSRAGVEAWKCTIAAGGICVLVVGVLDGFSTTERYLIPGLVLGFARCRMGVRTAYDGPKGVAR